MDYQEKIGNAVSKMKKQFIISIIIIIATIVLGHIVGNVNKSERTDILMAELSGNTYEFSDLAGGTLFEWEFSLDEGVGDMYSQYTSDISGFVKRHGDITYSISYDFLGKEYVVLDIKWDDGDSSQWKLDIGKNSKGNIPVLGSSYKEKNYSDTEEVLYANAYLKPLIIVIIVIVCVINLYNIWCVFSIKKNQENELRKKEQEDIQKKVNKKIQHLGEVWNTQMQLLNFKHNDSIKTSFENHFWVSNGNVYEAESKNNFICKFKDVEQEEYLVRYSLIPVSNIQCFSKEGDVQYTTSISGGGGGGFSVTGAIVGGLIAGDAGAIIGSRKKINDIKTESIKHDSRFSLIRYYQDEQLLSISYDGFDVYDYLLRKIPEKDFLSLQLKSASTSQIDTHEGEENIEAKMLTIKKLYDNGLISREEYETKKSELLNKI